MKRVNYVRAYSLRRPWLSKMTLTVAALIVTLMAIAELTRADKRPLLTPGTMSSAHAIAARCSDCHQPWQRVRDVRCHACHGRAPHASGKIVAPPCTSCHVEHSGRAMLTSVSDCTRCHRAIPNFAHHPEFHPIADTNPLHFNHQDHLAQGLTCASCHTMTEHEGRIDPAPVKYATNCAPCHALDVPHGGDPSAVYGFMLTSKKTIAEADDIFTNSCSLCHAVVKRGERMAVTPPAFPAQWLPKAIFSHTDHVHMNCETCHRNAAMPAKQVCMRCHAATKATTCATCHVYHEQARVALMSGA